MSYRLHSRIEALERKLRAEEQAQIKEPPFAELLKVERERRAERLKAGLPDEPFRMPSDEETRGMDDFGRRLLEARKRVERMR